MWWSFTTPRRSPHSSANSSRRNRPPTWKPASRTTRSASAWTPVAGPCWRAATIRLALTKARWKTACSTFTSGTAGPWAMAWMKLRPNAECGGAGRAGAPPLRWLQTLERRPMQALWMVLAAFLFASMGVCVKVASGYFNSAELVCYRGLIGILILWLLARLQRVTLATQYPGIHAWRSLVGVVSLGAWFFAIAHLPLATAMALNYLSSVWIAAFLVGGTLLAWRPSAGAPLPTLQGPLVLTVLAGFAGVVLLLRPSLHQNQSFAGLIGLLSGITAAFAYMQVVALARMGEPEERTVFYFAMGAAVAGGAALLLTGTSPWPGWPVLWLLPIGILAAAGQ